MPVLAPFINPVVNYGTDAHDYTAEAQNLQRRRSVSDAMLKRSLDPILVPIAKDNNQLSSTISPFAALAKLGETYMANKAGENVDTAEGSLAARYKAAENKEIADFTSGDTSDLKHLLKYSQSQFPTTRAAALEMLKEQQKGMVRPKDALSVQGASVPSRAVAATTGDLSKLEAAPQEHVVGADSTLVESVPGKPASAAVVRDNQPQFAMDPKTNEPITVRHDDGNGHTAEFQVDMKNNRLVPIDKSNRTNIRVDTHVAGSQARKSLEEEDSKALSASTAGAKSAIQNVGTVHRIKEVLDSGSTTTGTGAGFRQTLNRIGDTLGVTGKDTAEKLAKTTQLMQGMAQTELEASYQMKNQGQITEAERALLKRTAAGDIGNSEAEIRARLDAMEKFSRVRMKAQKDDLERYKGTYPDVNPGFHELPDVPAYQSPSDKYKASKGGGLAKPADTHKYDQYRIQ